MKIRENFSSGAPWEDKVGYSRAVRVGNVIEISGTVSILEGALFGRDDAYAQTKRCLEIIEEYIRKAGGKLNNIVRTRIYVTNIDQWAEIGRAHGEYFKGIKPATSMVEVNRLIDPGYLVEIEASAIVQ